jgi:cell division protein FtsQ
MSNRKPTPANRHVVTQDSGSPTINRGPIFDREEIARVLKKVRRIASIVGIVAGGIGLAFGTHYYLTHSPRFALREVIVNGAKRLTSESVITESGLQMGENLVSMDLEKVKERIEQDPWIDHAILRRKLPSTIELDVVERAPVAIASLANGTYLATADGVCFKRVEGSDPSDFPVITGLGDVANDSDSASKEIAKAIELSREIERVGLYGGHVEELAIEDDGGISAVIGSRGVRLVFGDDNFRSKVQKALKIEYELARRHARATTIFLDDDEHKDRVVVRLLAALPEAEVTTEASAKSAHRDSSRRIWPHNATSDRVPAGHTAPSQETRRRTSP